MLPILHKKGLFVLMGGLSIASLASCSSLIQQDPEFICDEGQEKCGVWLGGPCPYICEDNTWEIKIVVLIFLLAELQQDLTSQVG